MNAIIEDPDFQQALSKYTIKLLAPASAAVGDPNNLVKLRALPHLNIEAPENLMVDAIAYHANTDEARFKLLKKALYNKASNIILWTLRGGYGSARLLDALKKLPKPQHEKFFIGFSDITALHLFLAQQWAWKPIHAAGMIEILDPNKDPLNFKKIADWVSTKNAVAHLNDLQPMNTLAKKSTKIIGRLTGGNLSIIQTSVGTHWQMHSKGKIIFLEDVNEKGYKIDRILYHLTQAGIFKGAKAIVLGDFSDGDNHVELALKRFALEIEIPVFKTHQFGHGRMNYPLIYNAKTDIVVNKGNGSFDLTMR